MRTLIVGIGALGGLIAARLRAAGAPLCLATRDAASAAGLKASGLRVTGVAGALSVDAGEVAPLDGYRDQEPFDLVVLATKARDAIDVAPRLSPLLAAGGTLLPIQNGDVARLLADGHGERVLGGLSNLGAARIAPGVYEQRNAGHLLVGELAGGWSARAEGVCRWLGSALEVRVTPNLRGAAWSKLLLNCSVTTLGAIAGGTMRSYLALAEGRELFRRTYDEALCAALASGARPEKMFVDPLPPGWAGRSVPGEAYQDWLGQVVSAYGDAVPSMLQDFQRGRTTEIDFLNGYVVAIGQRHGVPTSVNAAIVEVVHAITRGELSPDPALLGRILHASR